jgi:hypothetical protein
MGYVLLVISKFLLPAVTSITCGKVNLQKKDDPERTPFFTMLIITAFTWTAFGLLYDARKGKTNGFERSDGFKMLDIMAAFTVWPLYRYLIRWLTTGKTNKYLDSQHRTECGSRNEIFPIMGRVFVEVGDGVIGETQ